ncbi:MAG: Holliday junction resolvase Hjc [Candidatus Pacearchaeota archaeon]
MSNKAKGSKAERELYQMFIDNHFRAVRVAGSGMMENTACDLIAGKKGQKYCIEAKSTKSPLKYISKEQISDFLVFADIFGLKPVVAVRYNREGWFFINPKQLEDSGKNWVISLEYAKKKAKRFSQYFCQTNNKNQENNIKLTDTELDELCYNEKENIDIVDDDISN